MRYEDWDILLFPQGCKIPLKEFKVACHVVHDAELSHTHGSFGLPTVSCFVPSLDHKTPFKVSIHSWSAPIVSQATCAYSKFPSNIKFEVRLFIDGSLVASTALSPQGGWPHVIAHSYDFSKNGELEPLRWPAFRRELLQQSYWSPADDLGRIKIVISEGYPRDSPSMPIERVKNIVAFSFQHVPMDILEGSSIAWPNPSMWKGTPFTASMPVPAYRSKDVDSHAHSPRRRAKTATQGVSSSAGSLARGAMVQPFGATAQLDFSNPQPISGGPLSGTPLTFNGSDPFGDSTYYLEWLQNMGMTMDDVQMTGPANTSTARRSRNTRTDESMPDYVPATQSAQTGFPTDGRFPTSMFMPEDDAQAGQMKVPTNTPIARPQKSYEFGGSYSIGQSSAIPADLAHCLTNSLLNQPMPLPLQAQSKLVSTAEVRSRKENRLQQPALPTSSAVSSSSTPRQEHEELRRVSQQKYMPLGGTVGGAQQAKSPKPQEVAGLIQRTPSGRFGADLTNLAEDPSLDTVIGTSNSMERETETGRRFTPGSAPTNEAADGRRASPHVGLGPFGQGSPVGAST